MSQSLQQHVRKTSREQKESGARALQHHEDREGTADAATISYIKRVLCTQSTDITSPVDSNAHELPEQPLDELLPPLTSSNVVDVQLYAIIAVVLQLFVQAWYNRITPDQDFVKEAVHIIAHCTRGIEQRLRHVDLESLLLDELPGLLGEHVKAVRISQIAKLENATILQTRVRYNALKYHLALDPVPVDVNTTSEQAENEVAWCVLLVDRILPHLLPPEDMTNPCLNVLVSEVLAELIFHNGICGKACEPWLLWDGIGKALRSSTPSTGATAREDAIQDINGASHGVKRQHRFRLIDMANRAFWSGLSLMMLAWTLIRTFVAAVIQAASMPARTDRPLVPSRTSLRMPVNSTSLPKTLQNAESNFDRRPMISMRIWGCMHELLSLDARMPWLSGALSLMQWILLAGPGQLCSTNSRTDKLISYHVQRKLLNASWLPSVLQAARNAIFPDNAMGPARIPPTTAETATIKLECAAAIVDAIPEALRTRFFATTDRDVMIEDIHAELDLLADPYINKGLIIHAIELIAVRLFPELAIG